MVRLSKDEKYSRGYNTNVYLSWRVSRYSFSPMKHTVHTKNYEIKSILSLHMLERNISYDMDKIGFFFRV